MPVSTPDLRVKISNKYILQMALPIAAAVLVPQLNFVINNIFLGHTNNDYALGVAGITGVFYLMLAVAGNGLNNGLQMLIARKAGENKLDEIGSLFNQGLRIAIVLACLGVLFTYFIAPFIFKSVLYDAQVCKMSVDFLKIRIWGLFFLYLYQMRNALLVGTNQSRLLIWGTASEALANVIFDYGFIFGRLGLPKLGFNGAAYASVIAEAVGLIVLFLVIQFKGISKRFLLFKHTKFNFQLSLHILKSSAPLIGQYLLSILVWEFFYILIEHQGKQASAISNVMRNVFGFFGCVTWAFAATSNTMVSNIIGQGLQDKVVFLVKKIAKLSVMFAAAVCIILNLFPRFFLQAYGQDSSFIEAAIPVVRVVSVAVMIMSVAVVWLNAVTGTGKTKVNLLIETLAITGYCTYVYLILEVFNKGIIMAWASEWIYWSLMLIPSYLYIKSGKWKDTKSKLS